ncbi:hypothetical protein FRX31_033169, partial [Thalictrum thalictroides]
TYYRRKLASFVSSSSCQKSFMLQRSWKIADLASSLQLRHNNYCNKAIRWRIFMPDGLFCRYSLVTTSLS